MKKQNLNNLPYMLYADSDGRIYEHPHFRMLGFSGETPIIPGDEELIPLSEFSKLFYIPSCPPMGIDPDTGKFILVSDIRVGGESTDCFAVAAFLEPGFVRTHLPAVDYGPKSYTLPMWGYTAVGFKDGAYRVAGFRIEYNHRWDPNNYDDRELIPAIKAFQDEVPEGPLIEHLTNCAVNYHCFAAKNLFLNRWEAPLPVSRKCNAGCLGCLSLQTDYSCESSHQRITFRPSKEEIVSLAVKHLNRAPDAIVSFGQGCEGEPLSEHKLIAESIKEIRGQTDKGTINLNTNGSRPERVHRIIESGLDSIRISLNSARPEFYRAYYRPKDYDFKEVLDSLILSRKMGVYTMVNYLVFPGITDQEEEINALIGLLRETGVNFLHLKNLCVDPQLYLEKMPRVKSNGVGMKQMISVLQDKVPDLKLGYFNRAVR
ncbi:MAG: radical SAM protein [Desulfobacterales bacterium]|nr:radical SAM protein [Desulfobacterales bacterium]